jgi:hypothetical protein
MIDDELAARVLQLHQVEKLCDFSRPFPHLSP